MKRKDNSLVLRQRLGAEIVINKPEEFFLDVRKMNVDALLKMEDYPPSLTKLKMEDEEKVQDALVLMLLDAVRFFNVVRPPNEDQLFMIADMIMEEYSYFSLMDLGICFKMGKLGRWGKVYDRLDGGIFLEWCTSYDNYRTEKAEQIKRKYKTIRWVLRQHISKGVSTLWTWEDDEFICLFNSYDDDARIYTAQQLLDKLEKL